MEKQNKSAFQRVLAVALTLIMVVGMLPMNVIALDVDDRATVTPIGGGVAVDDGNGNITVTVTEAALDWRAATTEHGEGWWVGVCVNAPESMTEEELALATYTVDGGLPEFFVTKSGGASYIQFWLPVTEEFLTAGISETDLYEFNWNGLGDNNQTVTLTVVPSENIVLNPKAPETYTVTDISENHGTVSFITEGERLEVGVTPNEGYQIREIRLDGVSYPVTGDDVWSYYGEFQITGDVELEVIYAELFQINVTYTGDGSVAVDGETVTTGGSVTVVEGTDTAVLVATPATGFRVSSITVDGQTTTFNVHAYEHTEELTKDQDHAVAVTFVQSFHNVQIEETQNGTAEAERTSVEHGGETKIIITPAEGYTVDTVLVNDVETTALSVLNDDQYVLTVSGVTEDQIIQVTFKTQSNAAGTGDALAATGDMVRYIPDTCTVIYKNAEGGATVLKTDRDGIRVTLATGAKLGGRDQQQIVITESAEVTKIELFYQEDDDQYPGWHRVADVSDENKLHLVIDSQILVEVTLPEADIIGEGKNYYCDSFDVAVTVKENAPGAGVQLVEYYIYRGDDKGEPTTIYEYVEGEEIQYDITDLGFTVDAESNNGEDLQILVAVKDRAGNIAAFNTVVHINHVQATVEFDNTNKQPANNGRYYRESREAVITITDDPDKFNPDGVQLNLAATNAQGQAVANAFTIGEWVSEGNQHTARITFNANANYVWQSLTYRNKVGTELTDITVNDDFGTPSLFTVDTTTPGGEVGIAGNFWGELLEIITFGLYTNKYFDITGTGTDDISPVTVQHYVHKGTNPLSEAALAGVEFSDMPDGKATINEEGSFIVYLKITDYAGNYAYISSDGAIVDRTAPVVTLTPEEPNENGIYGPSFADGVEVALSVSDGGDAGIERVEHWIVKDGVAGETTTWTKLEDVPEKIIVDTAQNNSCDVVIHVKVTDKAGNSTEATANLQIDITPPEVTLTPAEANKNDFYNGDAAVALDISDGVGAGIESVEYWIVKDGNIGNPTQSGSLAAAEESITVYADRNNSSDVVVHVKVTDKAGNITETAAELKIDIDKPTITLTPEGYVKMQTIEGISYYVYGAAGGEEVKITPLISDVGDAGIESVEYKIEKDGAAGEYVPWTEGYILVNKEANNSSNVVVWVKATDKAGNVQESPIYLDIDITCPKVVVEVSGEQGTSGESLGWFPDVRVATVTITEREGHLDMKAAKGAIYILAMNLDETSQLDENAYTVGDWAFIKGNTPDEDQYQLTITFKAEGYYQFGLGKLGELVDDAIADLAGNSCGKITGGYRWTNFYISTSAPTGTVSWGPEDGIKTTSDTLIEEPIVNYYNEPVVITVEPDNPQSLGGIYRYVYNGIPDENTLNNAEWGYTIKDSPTITVAVNQKATVYLKLFSKAGNESYISTNMIVVDNQKPKIDIMPEGLMTNGFYTGDVTIEVKVTDPAVNGVASGFEDGGITVVITDSNGKSMQVPAFTWQKAEGENGCVWTGEFVLENGQGFDNNEFTVEVNAKDKAGNAAEPVSKILAIDTQAPVVDISFVDNGHQTGKYFTGKRVATITVEDRNFEQEDIEIVITNKYGAIPAVSGWTRNAGEDGISDNKTTYTATIEFTADGAYTLEIVSCGDDAGNKGNDVKVNEFIIDNDAPAVTVTYTNNDARNDRYFKEARTATITITEQNFDENLVEITQTAAQGGVTPNVAWTHNGDTHVATLTYSVDGVYTFDITAKDKAGNESGAANFGGSVAAKDFVIDTTYEDMVTIGGVENGKAYGYGETPIPTVQIEDINLDEYNIKLTGIQKDKTIDLTDEVYALLNAGAQEVNGTFDIFQVVQDLDGIYTLSVYGLDKAGNEDREEVTFTVNRFGSVYVYNDYLMGLIAGGGTHTPKVTDDLVITEYNAAKLLAGSLVIEITRDGRPLEDPIYEATPEINDSVAVGESGWYQYRYTISKENFTSDGVYKITVSSKDAAGNAAENNNYDGMSITFRVDSTAPEITSVVGLEEAIIDATQVTVKYTAYDTLGLKSIQVYVDDVLVDEITDFSADLSNYSGSFSLTEKNAAQHVRIVVEDLSGNVTDTDSEYFVSAYEFHKDVTVSTNIFVQWFANKGLFWGSIAGVAAVAGLVIFLIVKKRKKA